MMDKERQKEKNGYTKEKKTKKENKVRKRKWNEK